MLKKSLLKKIKYAESLFQSGERENAIKEVVLLLKDLPRNKDLLNTLGIFYAKTEHFAEAGEIFKKLLKIYPDNNSYANNLVNLFVLQNNFIDAQDVVKSLADKCLDNYKYQRDCGIIFHKTGNTNLSKKYLLRALDLNSKNYDLMLTLSTVLLKKGEYSEGWRLYESRFNHSTISEQIKIMPKQILNGNIPRYKGEDLTNKTILIHAEQGYGDFIMSMRYFKNLREKYPGLKISVICKDPLQKLLEGNSEIFNVVSYEETEKVDLITADFWEFIMSIPRYFEIEDYKLELFSPYINHDIQIDNLNQRIIDHNKINIGISYHGNSDFVNDIHRSMSSLIWFKELTKLKQFNFIYLNIDNIEEQIKDLDLNLRCPELNTFQDTYGVLKNLDLVISTDTSIVHLAGAAGVECWTLLGHISSSWIWGEKESITDRYRSVKLYRQKKPGDWGGIMNKVKKDLLIKFSNHKIS